jgi:hypothetical protein
MEILDEPITNPTFSSKEWWKSRRAKYNSGLLIAGVIAFICYVIAAINLIMPYNDQFEITLFTTVFQGIGYLIMIGIANIFYSLGYWADKNFNIHNSEKVRNKIYNLGYWGSIGLPFLVPILIIVQYFILLKK